MLRQLIIACAIRDSVSTAITSSIYAPFVERALSLFAEAGLAQRPYPVDDQLLRRETVSGTGKRQQPVQLSVRAFCSDALRQVRIAHIEGGSNLQVLNFCAFSSLEYGLPSFAADLVTLPGVGRKTANVVRSVAFGLPGLPVDTHVLRLTRKLGITAETDPVKLEFELNPMLPSAERGAFSLRLILHGRRVCFARKPNCGECTLEDVCPASELR